MSVPRQSREKTRSTFPKPSSPTLSLSRFLLSFLRVTSKRWKKCIYTLIKSFALHIYPIAECFHEETRAPGSLGMEKDASNIQKLHTIPRPTNSAEWTNTHTHTHTDTRIFIFLSSLWSNCFLVRSSHKMFVSAFRKLIKTSWHFSRTNKINQQRSDVEPFRLLSIKTIAKSWIRSKVQSILSFKKKKKKNHYETHFSLLLTVGPQQIDTFRQLFEIRGNKMSSTILTIFEQME